MEYMALFIWLSLCLILGGAMHFVMAGALANRFVMLLAAPGVLIRKFTMTVTALLCGGTVTRVSIYELSSRDVEFEAEGTASVGKVLVPLAPLFGAAAVMVTLNRLFGSPLNLNYTPPALSALDSAGLGGYFRGTWALLTSVVRQATHANWSSTSFYVLFALVFSLAVGACAPMERVREAIMGAALVAVMLALLSSISIQRGPDALPSSPAWLTGVRSMIVRFSGVAFIMMVYGMLGALVVGIIVRLYEIVTRSSAAKTRAKAPAQPRAKKKAA